MYELAGPSTRPWQANSSNPSLALENSSSFDIRVQLTSTRKPQDTRYLTLKPGKPCLIGRASKTKGEAHKPSSSNALFDCPVVSRQHAEIKAHLWSPTGDQVTIVDHGSMHGTRVNNRKLEQGRNMALRNGDEIEFGDRVTRGDDTHDSVRVTYHRLSNEESHTMAADAPAESVGYRGDYPSDEEEEEAFSPYGGDDISDISDDGHEPDEPSSSKTTPEQAKGSIGSQHNPIQLEKVHPNFIDLTDDEQPSSPIQRSLRPARDTEQLVQIELFDDNPMRGAITSQSHVLDSNAVVEDSVDKNNSFYEWHQPPARNNMEPIAKPNYLLSVPNSNNKLADQLASAMIVGATDYHDESSNVSEAGMSDGQSDYEILENEQSDDLDEEADAPDDEDAVSEEEMLLDDEDAPAEDDDPDSLYDPDSYEPNRQPSPELGSDTGFIDEPSTGPANLNTTNEAVYTPISPQIPRRHTPELEFAPLRPPFDPIRAPDLSKPGLPPRSEYTSPYGLGAPGLRFPGAHMSFAPPPPVPFSYPVHSHSAQDWNLPGGAISMPPPPQPPSVYGAPPAPPPPPTRRPNGLGFHPFSPYPPPPTQGLSAPPSVSASALQPPLPNQIPSEHWYPNFESRKDQFYNPYTKSFTNRSPTTKVLPPLGDDRISIGELVAKKEAALDKEPIISPVTSAVKRKANEMSAGELLLEFDDSNNTTTATRQPHVDDVEEDEESDLDDDVVPTMNAPEVTEDADGSEEPTPRRRRITEEDDVSTAIAVEAPKVMEQVKQAETAVQTSTGLGSFAKMAGSAVLGGVATFAFLASPLAEKVLESML